MAEIRVDVGNLIVTSNSIKNGNTILDKFAYCAPDGKGKVKDAANISPQLAWSGALKEIKLFAVVGCRS